MKLSTLAFTISALLVSQSSFAIGDIAMPLQQQWDIARYQTDKKDREKAFEILAQQAKEVELKHPNNAEVLVWKAIILSTYAGEKGGFGALRLVKDAKALLDRAEKINPETLDGAIYTSLGSLYYQVPGWPLGFGDDEQANAYLTRALALNPDDIDANYFYGDFLLEEGDYQNALKAFEKALSAPPRPNRSIADEGRKAEIKAAQAKAESRL
ncbi:MAG: tetratricopeptide repeat protein [Gammaproteobacteria bacterium]|nr:tetratricopeptide repeat protein [Gammaproteobacteria bacterium]